MPEEHQNYVIQWEKNFVFPLDVIHHAKQAIYTRQMFRCHQNLKCPMDVLTITGKKFKRQFQNYRVASRLDEEPNEFQSAVFLATVGEDAMDIFDGFKFEQEVDMQDLGEIMEKFEDFCRWNTRSVWIVQVSSPTSRTVRNNQSVHLLSAPTGKEL